MQQDRRLKQLINQTKRLQNSQEQETESKSSMQKQLQRERRFGSFFKE